MITKMVIDDLCNSLHCGEKQLSSLIGESPTALISAYNSICNEYSIDQVQYKLYNLHFAISPLVAKKIEPKIILSTVRNLVFRDLDDNLDSVVSALKQNKYNKELLQVIALDSYKNLQDKNNG